MKLVSNRITDILQLVSGVSWRMGRDSNPRDACASAGFQDRCLQPLGHPSTTVLSATIEELPPGCNRRWTITASTRPCEVGRREATSRNHEVPEKQCGPISRWCLQPLGQRLVLLADRNRGARRRIIRLSLQLPAILRKDP